MKLFGSKSKKLESSNSFDSIKIGDQEWLALNFNIDIEGSFGFSEVPQNNDYRGLPYTDQKYLKEFGRLYTYENAIELCPTGWHIPSKEEWKQLIDYLGGASVSTLNALRPNGASGFNAFPAGSCYEGKFEEQQTRCKFWTCSIDERDDEDWMVYFSLNYIYQDEIPKFYYSPKNNCLSVRYLKD